MMTVEEKPDVTYNEVGGCPEQVKKIREVVEMPLTNPERFVSLGIDPPKGVLLYGPPGTGKKALLRGIGHSVVVFGRGKGDAQHSRDLCERSKLLPS